VLSEEKPEVRELKLTKLGSKNAEIKLTLTDGSLLSCRRRGSASRGGSR
jgi:hypothetical protein